jgi:hypothetical protein
MGRLLTSVGHCRTVGWPLCVFLRFSVRLPKHWQISKASSKGVIILTN